MLDIKKFEALNEFLKQVKDKQEENRRHAEEEEEKKRAIIINMDKIIEELKALDPKATDEFLKYVNLIKASNTTELEAQNDKLLSDLTVSIASLSVE